MPIPDLSSLGANISSNVPSLFQVLRVNPIILVDVDNTLAKFDRGLIKEYTKHYTSHAKDKSKILTPEELMALERLQFGWPDEVDLKKQDESIPAQSERKKWIQATKERTEQAAETRKVLVTLMKTPGFIETLDPVPGALEALIFLEQKCNCRVYLCTTAMPFAKAPEGGYEITTNPREKYRWVYKSILSVTRDNDRSKEWVDDRLILTRNKTLVSGHILIDDKEDIVNDGQTPSWNQILFRHTEDSRACKQTPELRSWTNVIKVLTAISDALKRFELRPEETKAVNDWLETTSSQWNVTRGQLEQEWCRAVVPLFAKLLNKSTSGETIYEFEGTELRYPNTALEDDPYLKFEWAERTTFEGSETTGTLYVLLDWLEQHATMPRMPNDIPTRLLAEWGEKQAARRRDENLLLKKAVEYFNDKVQSISYTGEFIHVYKGNTILWSVEILHEWKYEWRRPRNDRPLFKAFLLLNMLETGFISNGVHPGKLTGDAPRELLEKWETWQRTLPEIPR